MHGCNLAFKMLTCGLPHIGADGGQHGREGGREAWMDGWMDGYVVEETGMCMIKGEGGLGTRGGAWKKNLVCISERVHVGGVGGLETGEI